MRRNTDSQLPGTNARGIFSKARPDLADVSDKPTQVAHLLFGQKYNHTSRTAGLDQTGK